jgi:hypothetical protein
MLTLSHLALLTVVWHIQSLLYNYSPPLSSPMAVSASAPLPWLFPLLLHWSMAQVAPHPWLRSEPILHSSPWPRRPGLWLSAAMAPGSSSPVGDHPIVVLPQLWWPPCPVPSAPLPLGCPARRPAAHHGCHKLQHLLSTDRSSSAPPTSPSRRPPPHRTAASQPQLYPGSGSARSSGDLHLCGCSVRGMVVNV